MMSKITTAVLLSCVAAGVQAQSVCTRSDLQAAVYSYVAAQGSGDVSKMALADDAVLLENMATVDKFVKAPWGIPCARLEGGAYTNRNNDPRRALHRQS